MNVLIKYTRVKKLSQSHLADCDDRLSHLIRRLNELRLGSWKIEFVNENLRAEILSMKLKCVHHTPFKTSVLTSIKCKSMFAVQHSVSHALTLAPQSTSCSFICSSYFNLASLVPHFWARRLPLSAVQFNLDAEWRNEVQAKHFLKRQHTWKTMTRIQTSHFFLQQLTLSKSWYMWRWGEIICYQ